MTYVIPDVQYSLRLMRRIRDNTHIAREPLNEFDDIKYNTHIWDNKYDVDGYMKCLYCGLEIRVRNHFIINIYTLHNVTCDEYLIKNIIE